MLLFQIKDAKFLFLFLHGQAVDSTLPSTYTLFILISFTNLKPEKKIVDNIPKKQSFFSIGE